MLTIYRSVRAYDAICYDLKPTDMAQGIGRFIYIGLKAKRNEFIELWPTWWDKYGRTLLVSLGIQG